MGIFQETISLLRRAVCELRIISELMKDSYLALEKIKHMLEHMEAVRRSDSEERT